MNKIYKWKLSRWPGEQRIEMPAETKILSIQAQKGEICLWGEVPGHVTEDERVERIINAYGTVGPTRSTSQVYIATIVDSDYVCHFYDGGIAP